jgi:hypothetical protein
MSAIGSANRHCAHTVWFAAQRSKQGLIGEFFEIRRGMQGGKCGKQWAAVTQRRTSLVGRFAPDRGLVIPRQAFVRCSQKVNSGGSSSDERAIADT